MTSETAGDITRILENMRGGDRQEAFDRLLPLVYDELKGLATARLRHERSDHTLQATALVHEAYIRLLANEGPSWNDRRHFFRAAAQAMRRILIDHARRRGQMKRGGGQIRVTLEDVEASPGMPADDLVALDEGLLRLEEQDPRMAEIVSLRFFAGLTVEETAQALDISERTVKREWAVARAWLYEALKDHEHEVDE